MKYLLTLLILLISPSTLSAPSVLTIDKDIKRKERSLLRWIQAAHTEIPHSHKKQSTRYAILQGMLSTKGYSWAYEGEEEDHIFARMDYRGSTIIVKIEYSPTLIQLKYHSATDIYKCKNLTNDGICYKNNRRYFGYLKNLRNSIAKIANNI